MSINRVALLLAYIRPVRSEYIEEDESWDELVRLARLGAAVEEADGLPWDSDEKYIAWREANKPFPYIPPSQGWTPFCNFSCKCVICSDPTKRRIHRLVSND